MVNISTLSQSMNQISRLKTQQKTLQDLTTQLTTGKKTQQMSGLGQDVLKSSRSRTGVNALTTYSNNINNANRRIQLMLSSIDQLKKQADNISTSLTTTTQEGDYPDLGAIQQLAQNVYDFILDTMNQKDGELYLFGGSDTNQKPISDTGFLSSYLGEYVPDASDINNPALVSSGMIGDWGDGTITTDQFIASYHSINETVLGYSDALTSGTAGKTTVRVDDNSEFDYTNLANNKAMKDIVMVLGVLKSLPPVTSAPGALNDPTATTLAEDTQPSPPAEKQENFFKVINDLTKTLNSAIDSLDQQTFNLSQVQAQITIVKNSQTVQINAYQDIIEGVENIDDTEVSAKILQMQTQLESSFQVTALLAQLTLANYLSA